MNSSSAVEQWVVRILPIVSNLAFALAAIRWYEQGRVIRAFHSMLVALWTSPAYHLCTGFGACIFTATWLHVQDFWTAELAIPLIALYFIRFSRPYVETWLILLSAVILGIVVSTTSTNFVSQAIVAAASVGVVLVYAAWYRIAHGRWPEYDIVQLTLGIGLTALGVCFFVVQDWWPPYYGYNHSYWHALVGMGSYFIAGIRPPADLMLNLSGGIDDALAGVLPVPAWRRDYDRESTRLRAVRMSVVKYE